MSLPVWQFAEFTFDEQRHELRRNHEAVSLESKPKEVLLFLLRHAGRVKSIPEITLAVWKSTHVSEQTVPVAVSKIRDALDGTNRERIVRTVKGHGYTLNVETQLAPLPIDDPAGALQIGQLVPRRQGWLLTQHLQKDAYRTVWLTKEQFGGPGDERSGVGRQHIVRLSWSEIGLGLLRAESAVYEALGRAEARSDAFSQVAERLFDAAPYLLETEYLGPDLQCWAAQQGGLLSVPESVRVAVMAELAAALATLHAAGQVHGDLSPASVHLNRQCEGWRVRLDGFGRFAPQAEQGSYSASSPSFCLVPGAQPRGPSIYNAPELTASNIATQAGDIHALGILLYQVTAGNLVESPMPGWEDRIPNPVLRMDIADSANLNPEVRCARFPQLAAGLRDLADRQLVAEQLKESRCAEDRTRQRLAIELGKRPLQRALVGTLVLLLLAVSVGTYFKIHSLRQAQDQAREEQKQAQTLQTFMEHLLFDGDAAMQGPITSEGLVERALGRAWALEGSPTAHAALLNTVGSVYAALDENEKADQVLNRALLERVHLFGNDSAEAAETMGQQTQLLLNEGLPQAAMMLGQKALAIEQRVLPADNIAIFQLQTTIAEIWIYEGDYDRAVALLEQSRQREAGHPELIADLSNTLNDLSLAANYQEKFEESVKLQEQSLQIDRNLFGNRHPDIGQHLMSISNAHDMLGQFKQAVVEARDALAILEESLPPTHHDIAAARAHVGTELAHDPASLPEARACLEEALKVLKREPERSSTEAYADIGIGAVALQQGQYQEALDAYQQSLSIYRKLYSKPQAAWVSSLSGIAAADEKLSRWEPMADAAAQAYQIAHTILSPHDRRRLHATVLYAQSLLQKQRRAEAEVLLRDVVTQAPEGDVRTEQDRREALLELAGLARR